MSWRAVQTLLDLAQVGDISTAALLHGVPFEAEQLRRLGWVPWHQYCRVLEQFEDACGGPEQLDTLCRGQYHNMLSAAAPFVRAFVAPAALYRAVYAGFLPPMFPNQQILYSDLGDGRVQLGARMIGSGRSCETFYRVTMAATQGTTQILGLPCAELESGHTSDRAGEWVLLLPPSQTLLGRAWRGSAATMRTVAALVDEMGSDLRQHIHALTTTHDVVKQQVQRMVALNRIAQDLSQRTDVDSLIVAIVRNLHEHTSCVYVAVSAQEVRHESGERPAADIIRALPLVVGGREVGTLEVAAPDGMLDYSFVSDLTPWLAIALENARAFNALARGQATENAVCLKERLSAANERWKLTPRQSEVLRSVAQGLSNKETAARLDCAENTIELHVTQLLRKAEAGSRAQLIARFWSA